jgi:predicted regulator of Ras-like GTPase activity (Roadblock/LC7/MglB family)
MASVFKGVLQDIQNRVDGTRAVSLIGLDGIPVDSVSDGSVPLETLGAELGSFVRSIGLSNTDLDTGAVEQFSLVTERYTTFLSAVTSEYFILLVLRPDGNYGRARFELRKAKHALQSELS